MKLSEHFSLEEMTKSQTALRRNLPNTPSEAQTEALVLLCENVLEPVRSHFSIPFTPSSGYRSAELCVAIGSSVSSQHAKGEAADFEVPSISNLELCTWIINNLDFDQLILECYTGGNTGWVHCSYKPEGNRKEVLTYDKENGYRKGLLT
ncbi:MAG: peptidase M15A [Phycisphaerae bacterium]|nr:peptidase M15A [Phycisphaerae bacterium]